MAARPTLVNTVRDARAIRGWSQGDLATRAGLSRAGVSAIETGRLVPSAAAALALASAFGGRVEDLFRLAGGKSAETWAWPARRGSGRFWRAEVGGTTFRYPAEPTEAGLIPHDGLASPESADVEDGPEAGPGPSLTLVVATCDPAVALLAGVLARASGVRLIPLSRPSGAALDLLGRGLVHAAGIHLEAQGSGPDRGNAAAVDRRLGPGYRLLRVARWDEGLAVAPTARASTVGQALGRRLRWVGREPGSGARQCLDELFDGQDTRPPRRIARDHRGVAEAVRSGWADVGVCLRLTAEEAGLDFLPVRRESYDLAFPAALESDPRLIALASALRSPAYRRALAALPGVDLVETGEFVTGDGSFDRSSPEFNNISISES